MAHLSGYLMHAPTNTRRGATVTTKETTYRRADGSLCDATDPDRLTLLSIAGRPVPLSEALALGLLTEAEADQLIAETLAATSIDAPPVVDPAAESEKSIDAPPATKVVDAPPATKAVDAPPATK